MHVGLCVRKRLCRLNSTALQFLFDLSDVQHKQEIRPEEKTLVNATKCFKLIGRLRVPGKIVLLIKKKNPLRSSNQALFLIGFPRHKEFSLLPATGVYSNIMATLRYALEFYMRKLI